MKKYSLLIIGLITSLSTFAQDYIIENAVQLKNENPRTFSIPRSEQRNNLKPEQVVKLIFTDNNGNSERMWVVVQKKENETYIGELNNNPAHIKSLTSGDTINFKANNVVAIWNDNDHMPYEQYIRIDQEIFDNKLWPKYLLKMKSTEEGDSGWIISTHPLKPEQNFSQFHKIEVESVLNYFQMLDSVLDQPASAQWIWDDKTLEYKREK